MPNLNTLFSLHSRALAYIALIMNVIRTIMVGFILTAGLLFTSNAAAVAVPNLQPEKSVRMEASIAKPAGPEIRHYAQRKAESRISASQAKSAAQRRYPGAKFVNIKVVGNAYRVRLQQKNGRIVDVSVDARTGRVRN